MKALLLIVGGYLLLQALQGSTATQSAPGTTSQAPTVGGAAIPARLTDATTLARVLATNPNAGLYLQSTPGKADPMQDALGMPWSPYHPVIVTGFESQWAQRPPGGLFS